MLSSQRLWPRSWSSCVGFIFSFLLRGGCDLELYARPFAKPTFGGSVVFLKSVWVSPRARPAGLPVGITTPGSCSTMYDSTPKLTADEMAAEAGELLPDKEVFSLLDLFVNLDLALDLAAPVDLAVAANANVVAPIDAAVSANVLSVGSTAEALADQGVMLDQYLSGDAIADAPQQ